MKAQKKLKGIEGFQEKYLFAKSKRRRFFLAVEFVLSLFVRLFFFGVMWMTMCVFFAKCLFVEEGEISWGYVLVLVPLLALGSVPFLCAIVDCARFFLILFSAPPVGSVPPNESSENPFSAEPEQRDAEEKPKAWTWKSRGFLALFGGAFFFVGVVVSFSGFRKYQAEDVAAKTWISVPCKVVSAELVSESGNKGKIYYARKIKFEYFVAGKKYTGDKIFFTNNSSSSNYSKQNERLLEWEKKTSCWFNPKNAEESSLMPPEKGFSYRKSLPLVLGVIFALAGGFLLSFALLNKSRGC